MKVFGSFLKGLPLILACSHMFFSCISGFKQPPAAEPELLGIWEFTDCTYKNTIVRGTLKILKDKMIFDMHVLEDFGRYDRKDEVRYSLSAKKLIFETEPGFRIGEYYFVQDDQLYFSSSEMKNVITDWTDAYRKTNWLFQLKRK